ncbi:flagellar export protein FliJ [Solimonas flava]|uniref:flagellar export protein FliJ n=1 Tax=Solimonas flava TaxID=415849 RepID=UPI0004262C7F|nr:flagellar export protein FliJ [Solimonas flava]
MASHFPSARLQPLQQLADTRESEAARRLLDAQRLKAEREQRLAELARYREEYERQPAAATPQLLRNRQAFLERLREAERFQRQLVEQAQRGVDQGRAQWLLQQRETRTVAELTACYVAREQREEARREQRHHDELATQNHWRTRRAEAD